MINVTLQPTTTHLGTPTPFTMDNNDALLFGPVVNLNMFNIGTGIQYNDNILILYGEQCPTMA